MTRCLIKSLYNGDKEMDLTQALIPEALDRWSTSGVAEDARDAAQRANETLGRLLADLVERQIVTATEASAIAGNNDEIEVL